MQRIPAAPIANAMHSDLYILPCALCQTMGLLGKKAREGTIGIDDMAGGTFTISNGGVYGSLLSTPIINPPQVRTACSRMGIAAKPTTQWDVKAARPCPRCAALVCAAVG